MLSKILKKVASKKLLGVSVKGAKKKKLKAVKDKAKSIAKSIGKVDNSKNKVKDARQVKKGLKIAIGGKGKDAKAKPVGTPTQRAKAAEKRLELKLDRMVEDALQRKINAMGEPKFAKGGMTKKTKYMAKGGAAKRK